ncbi:MAG: calcium/sodium antiporter [Verrucomicrobiales bacterium]|nr:calcium/sodium antiporter [Verrucomicrobiales bacterium]
MSILIDVTWLIAGLLALYFGAEWLVNSAAKISLKFGISPLVVGLTVVAFGTSAPELFVSLKFNSTGNPDMSLGNVVGSNICNIGMVLGISAFICTLFVKRSLLTRDMSVLVASSLLFSVLLWDGIFTRLEGILLFSIVVGYTIFRLKVSHLASEDAKLIEEEIGGPEEAFSAPNWKLALFVILGLVVLYLGSVALEKGGVSLAQNLGVPEALISLTVIAFSTSVPELATSIVASLKREGDLIVGNIVGSCLFNLLCVIGFTAIIKPIDIVHVHREDLFVMLAFTILLVPMMMTRRKISRIEGTILLLGYITYCGYLWFERIDHQVPHAF